MLTGGSNFGLQAGGEVVTAYAPDTVIDSFLLRHEPRFTLYKRMYGVLSSTAVSDALLNTDSVPKAVIVPSNASSSLVTTIRRHTWSCSDTDPAHVGQLDASQEWDMLDMQATISGLRYFKLKNRATGLCLSPMKSLRPPSLVSCSRGSKEGFFGH